jgi:ribosome recycling factor
MLSVIERAIFEANLGITPQNDGQIIRLIIPPLTEERRREMAKKAKAIGEESKVGVRNARRDAMEAIKKEVKNGYPEDLGKKKETEAQTLTDRYNQRVDTFVEEKMHEIMKV